MPKPVFLGMLGACLLAGEAQAAEGIPSFINLYEIVTHAFHLGHEWVPTVGALLITLVVLVAGLYFKRSIEKDGDNIVPSGKFGLRYLLESILEFLHGLAKDNCGPEFRKFLPLLAGLFIFILFCNLSGLIPVLPPATESMDTNVAMGIVAFFVYNYAGIREHGAGYVKHFLGPVALIAPLFFCIELVSHASRPLSLGLRLTGNIFGDHLLLGVFTGLTKLVLPSALMFFGLLVAVVQSFVFTLLTALYISMAISHEH